jgi:hypothetical protein
MKLKAASVNTYCIYNLNNWSNFVCIRVTPEQTITSFNPMTETSLSLRAHYLYQKHARQYSW